MGNTGSFEKGRTKSDVDTATYPWLYGSANTPGSGWFELHTGLVYVDAEMVITEKVHSYKHFFKGNKYTVFT